MDHLAKEARRALAALRGEEVLDLAVDLFTRSEKCICCLYPFCFCPCSILFSCFHFYFILNEFWLHHHYCHHTQPLRLLENQPKAESINTFRWAKSSRTAVPQAELRRG